MLIHAKNLHYLPISERISINLILKYKKLGIMKRLNFLINVLIIILISNSCEIETPPRYFEVNGERNKLNVAFADDWGPSDDLSYRTWAISLRSDEVMPGAFITFLLGSYDNLPEISEGNYDYNFLGGEGTFTEASIGYNIDYDYKGYPINGLILRDDLSDFSGSINFDGKDNKFYLNIDIEVFYQNQVYTIIGEYEGRFRIDEDVVNPESY